LKSALDIFTEATRLVRQLQGYPEYAKTPGITPSLLTEYELKVALELTRLQAAMILEEK
jgi:hypothetical protein